MDEVSSLKLKKYAKRRRLKQDITIKCHSAYIKSDYVKVGASGE